MSLLWVKELTTGVEWQDAQHRELYNKINELIDASKKDGAALELRGLFRFIENYCRTHFRDEESAMYKYNYPGRFAHKAEHKRFMEGMAQLKQGFENSEAYRYVIEARKLLADWFYSHIQKVDKELGGFLLAHMKAGVETKAQALNTGANL